ncbi:MAG: hypothetical protein ACRELY_02485 [Polyangiaceae bacterium]
MRVWKRLCCLSLAGAGLSLASCSSTGFAGHIYMSPDQDGKRTQSYFYQDAAETPAIYAIIPMVSGKDDESLDVSVRIKSLFGKAVTVYKPFTIAQLAPGVQTRPTNLGVPFPDPPPILTPNPADPNNPISLPQLRAVGDFQIIATLNGDTETVNFGILAASPDYQQESDPNAGTPNAAPIPGTCTTQTIARCPVPTQDQVDNAAADICCTTDGNCGIGIVGTGLCAQHPFNQ